MTTKTFFISDTHFGHEKIISLANRPFQSVEEMNQSLIDNWNRTVGHNDHVYFLGDFCWPNKYQDESYFWKQLKGKKNFVIGNHDKVDVITNNLDIICFDYYHEIKINKKKFILFHYPIEEWNGRFKGNIHIHGHTHNQPLKLMKNRFNVSVENINYTPIELEELISKIEDNNIENNKDTNNFVSTL